MITTGFFKRLTDAMLKPCASTLSIAMLVLMLPGTASAQTVSGFGSHKCSDYLHAVSRERKVAIDGYISWAQGFVSARNWLRGTEPDIAVDPGGLTYWLVDHCGANQSDFFYEATQAFIRAHAR